MSGTFREDAAPGESPALRPLRDADELDALGDHEVAILYKHSPVCGMSARAIHQVRLFAAAHPDTPIYLLDVIRQRPLARSSADRYGIRHESPQAIVLRHGEPEWHDSHRAITADALADAVRPS